MARNRRDPSRCIGQDGSYVKHNERLTCDRDRGGHGQNREDKRAAHVPHPTGSYPSPLDSEQESRTVTQIPKVLRTSSCRASWSRVDRRELAESALKGISIALTVTLRYGACAGKKDMMATDFVRKDYAHSEGQVAKAIEEQTAKLPSDVFLWLAVGSMAVSATMQMMGKKQVSLFVAQWAPTLLIFGLYNKLVKQLGSDRSENAV